MANPTSPEKSKVLDIIQNLAKKKLTEADVVREFNAEDVVERLHQFIRAEKPYFLSIMNPADLIMPYYVHPKMSNRRILAQSGVFIIYVINVPGRSLYYPQKIVEYKIVIEVKYKARIRSELDGLGINENTLFPEIDKAANQIKARYI